MPQRSESERRDDRAWYRQPYDYRAAWRPRQWGPLDQRFDRHPLRAIFQAGAMSHDMGLRWLKSKLFIGQQIECVEAIHPDDVDWILDMAQSRFSMEWIEDLRERWKRFLKKGA